jgi:hypothetical protein
MKRLPRADYYEVGYKKPPKANQFVKGRSGNPRGRPKDTSMRFGNLKQLFEAELLKPIGITEGGKRKSVTKAEAFVARTVNSAIGGDKALSKAIFAMPLALAPPPHDEITLTFRATPRDKEAIEFFLNDDNDVYNSSKDRKDD